jgi:hypothetical protein
VTPVSPIISSMLSSFCSRVITGSARWLGLGAFLAVLPFSVSASTVTVDFGISLNGMNGTGEFSYDPSLASAAGGLGAYADGADGLESFDLTYDGVTYSSTSASLLDGTTVPTVFLPGNSTIQHGLQYGFLGLWVVSGSCTDTGTAGDYTCTGPGGTGDATILGLGRTTEAFLASGVTSAQVSYTGSDLVYNLGLAPDITEITGTVTSESVAATPEPTTLWVTALGFAGVWIARRRSATRAA